MMLVIVVIIAGIVVLNVWWYRDRARMTRDERAAEDAETRRDVQIW